MQAAVLLFVVLTLPGQKPIPHSEPAQSLEACIEAVQEILGKGMASGAHLQAGCVIAPAPTDGT